MPTYEVTAPDGQVFEVTAPEGASEQDVLAYAQANFKPKANTPAPKAPPRNEWGRAAALAARNAVEGVAGVAGIVTDPAVVLWNKMTGRQDMGAQAAVGSTLDTLGFPNAETGAERFTSAVNRGLAGGGGMVGLGRAGLAQASPVARGVFGMMAQGPGAQLAGSGLGAGAAQLTQEAGGSPAAQTLAGLGGALSPAMGAAAVRGVVRGPSGAPMLANIDTFRGAGADVPTVGQGAGNRRMQGLEALLSRTPGGAGVFANKADEQSAAMGQRVEDVASSLAPKASAEQAGRAIERGVTGSGGFMERFRGDSARLYANVDAVLPPSTPVALTRTQAALQRLAAPLPGAPNTSQVLASPRIASIAEAVQKDAANGAMTYEALKGIRSRLGELIADSGLMADTPTKQLRQLYGALSDDMTQAALATKDPRAISAMNRANTHYRAGMARLEVLERVIERNGGPEKVFAAATQGTREGATTLRAVMRSLPQDGQKQLAAAVIRRLGRANPSNQNELGEVFSTEKFLTNWNTMAPEARSALFDRFGPRYIQNINKIARLNDVAAAAGNIRQGAQVFRNPPGTAAATVQLGTGAAFVLSVFQGNAPAAAGIAGGVAAANLGARAMVNPRFVEWLAKSTQVPPSALAGSLASLRKEAQATKDDELLEIATALEDARKQQIAGNGNQGDQANR